MGLTQWPQLLLYSLSVFVATMEQRFYEAVEKGMVEDVKEILMRNPNLDVNWRNEDGFTAIRCAARGDLDSIVSILLAHPDIDVNSKTGTGWTPFNSACYNCRTSTVRMLLRDPRVKVNEPTNDGQTRCREWILMNT